MIKGKTIEEIMKYTVKPGKQYKAPNGHVYTVLFLTNEHTPERIKDNPVTVIYIGPLGRLWSNPLIRFCDKMKEITELKILKTI